MHNVQCNTSVSRPSVSGLLASVTDALSLLISDDTKQTQLILTDAKLQAGKCLLRDGFLLCLFSILKMGVIPPKRRII
jgi:hypothetical protein